MKVLIALDDSEVSARAAREAVRLFADAEFLVINVAVLPVPWVGAAGFGAVAPLDVDPEWAAGGVPDAGEAEVDLMARAEAAGVPHPEPVVKVGDPITQIVAAAEAHEVDVIVVGSHDKSALTRLVDPSVSSGVVRGTPIPVLVVSGAEA